MTKMLRRIWGSQLDLGLLALSCMVAALAWALIFEHFWDYIPCSLCLKQRVPYYAGIPVAFIAIVVVWFKGPQYLIRGVFAVTGLLMTCSLALGIYHSGLEWGWWAGPAQCTVGSNEIMIPSAENLLNQLSLLKPPSCNKAAGRFLGLSFAGWNVIASIAIAFMAFRGAAIRKSASASGHSVPV